MPDKKRNAIAAFLGLGGAYGLAMLLDGMRGTEQSGWGRLMPLVPAIGLCFAIVGGWLLWRNQLLGYRLAFFALFLQIPHVELPGLSYWLYTSGRSTVWAHQLGSSLSFGVQLDWGSSFGFYLFRGDQARTLGINVLAIVGCYFLYNAFLERVASVALSPVETTAINAPSKPLHPTSGAGATADSM